MMILSQSGYQIIRGVFSLDEIAVFRAEADRVAKAAGSVCVRHLNARSDLFARLATSVDLMRLLTSDMLPVRSILFDKTPDQNWPVAWHQDLTLSLAGKVMTEGYGPWSVKEGIVHVQPPAAVLEKMLTLRIHLDEASRENGALKVIPGSHKLEKISAERIHDYVDGCEVVCECDPGDVLLMSPLLLHSSSRSAAPLRRRIVHFEYAPHQILPKELAWHDAVAGESSPVH
jgi:hypothetical protein